MSNWGAELSTLKPRLHQRVLSRNSTQFLSRFELHQVLNRFQTSAISRRQNRRWFTRAILKLQLGARQKLHRVARLCKRAYRPGLDVKLHWCAESNKCIKCMWGATSKSIRCDRFELNEAVQLHLRLISRIEDSTRVQHLFKRRIYHVQNQIHIKLNYFSTHTSTVLYWHAHGKLAGIAEEGKLFMIWRSNDTCRCDSWFFPR